MSHFWATHRLTYCSVENEMWFFDFRLIRDECSALPTVVAYSLIG